MSRCLGGTTLKMLVVQLVLVNCNIPLGELETIGLLRSYTWCLYGYNFSGFLSIISLHYSKFTLDGESEVNLKYSDIREG